MSRRALDPEDWYFAITELRSDLDQAMNHPADIDQQYLLEAVSHDINAIASNEWPSRVAELLRNPVS